MTEHRVEAKATPFGRAVLEIADERDLFPFHPGDMGLGPDLAQLLEGHLDGVDNTRDENGTGFVRAVAFALGLDPENPDDYGALRELAYTHVYQEPYPARSVANG